jgi:hypothetical protein
MIDPKSVKAVLGAIEHCTKSDPLTHAGNNMRFNLLRTVLQRNLPLSVSGTHQGSDHGSPAARSRPPVRFSSWRVSTYVP